MLFNQLETLAERHIQISSMIETTVCRLRRRALKGLTIAVCIWDNKLTLNCLNTGTPKLT